MTPIQIIGIITGMELFIALIVMWKEIVVFFFPQNYNRIIMLESDGNIKSWIQRKNEHNQFLFKEGLYNMYIGGTND